MRTILRRATVAAVPAATLPVALLVAAPGTAQASPAPVTISISHQAVLIPPTVTVTYRCVPAAGAVGNILVDLQQGAAFSTTDLSAFCDGVKHTVYVVMGTSYTAGKATAGALLSTNFPDVQAETTVKLGPGRPGK